MRTNAETVEQIEKAMQDPPCNDYPMEYCGGTLVIAFPEGIALLNVDDKSHPHELRKAVAMSYLFHKTEKHAHFGLACEIATEAVL